MDSAELLRWIRRDGASIVEAFLPLEAHSELNEVIRDGRHEVDPNVYLMFVSVRAMLHKGGMPNFDSDRRAARIMALLNA